MRFTIINLCIILKTTFLITNNNIKTIFLPYCGFTLHSFSFDYLIFPEKTFTAFTTEGSLAVN